MTEPDPSERRAAGGAAARPRDPRAAWSVRPGSLVAPASIECGLAGTVMRFVPPLAALAPGEVAFDGDERARARPMAALLDALRSLGVDVRDDGRGFLPFVVSGTG